MRIIAGSLKGRRLEPPAWDGLRPTSDKLRETLFNVLGARVHGARVLDGFAGTGALGIEALSRGAAHVTFVERDPRAVDLVRRNLASCGIPGLGRVVSGTVARTLERWGAAAEPPVFDIILLDPPYGVERLEPRVAARPPGGAGARRAKAAGSEPRELEALLVGVAPLVAAGGVVVLEHARKRRTPDRAGALMRVRVLPAGDSALSFYAMMP